MKVLTALGRADLRFSQIVSERLAFYVKTSTFNYWNKQKIIMAKTLKLLPLQNVFIQKLKENLPKNVGLAEEMAEILEISTDSAYRRIRGETDLSIDEVFKLTKKYNISVDSVFSNLSDTVTFAYTKLTDSAENFEKYLSRILNHLKLLNTQEERKIVYVAEEVPIFHSFFSQKFIEFKLFYWQRSVLNVPDYQGKKFEFGIIPQNQIEIALECSKEYKKVPSVEIWTNETILTATKQLEFYVDSGVFKNKSDALDVLEEIKKMVQYIEQSAESSRKEVSSKTENYQLYNSEVVLGTNCIYVKMPNVNYTYISFNTMNSLTTNNHEFCDETEHWMRNIIKKSTLISGVAEKERYRFFSSMYKNIENCHARLKSL
jgi:plasmid maintenance system antidote protein VapI